MADPLEPPRPALPRRLAAMIYDILLVLPLVMVSVALVMGLRSLLGFGPSAEGIVRLNPHLVQLLAGLTVMAFFCWFWLKNGQTLGMQAWRIKLVDFGGGPPSLRQLIIRCLGATLSTACLGLGFLWCLVDRKRRYWHDYLSSTELVLLPKKGSDASVEPPGAPPAKTATR
ncbi:MAG: RDD family protein [Pseudomonadales bacterium]|nr:RDD family protein [Halieaceae bacterium]MCP5190785.1 RDD family protein [Pseudomonadales bacterium]MCP5205090.1 RDD family protein [Pseudomonadales bacterium]